MTAPAQKRSSRLSRSGSPALQASSRKRSNTCSNSVSIPRPMKWLAARVYRPWPTPRRSTTRTNPNAVSRSWPARPHPLQPSSWSPRRSPSAERHDNIEAIYKKLKGRDTSDITELLKEPACQRRDPSPSAGQGQRPSQPEAGVADLSKIDLEKLRVEFEKRVKRKATAIEDIRQLVEDQLARMLAHNPLRMDYKKYPKSSPTTNPRERPRHHRGDLRQTVDLANSLDAAGAAPLKRA